MKAAAEGRSGRSQGLDLMGKAKELADNAKKIVAEKASARP